MDLTNPLHAAALAAAVTAVWVHVTHQGPKKNSTYAKPAALVGLLVWFIVNQGSSAGTQISKEPF